MAMSDVAAFARMWIARHLRSGESSYVVLGTTEYEISLGQSRSTLQLVYDCQNRMPEEHPWSGVSHDVPDLVAFFRLVTMNRTVRAGRLVRAERAAVESAEGVIEQRLTLRAETAASSMMAAAIDADHFRDCLLFDIHR